MTFIGRQKKGFWEESQLLPVNPKDLLLVITDKAELNRLAAASCVARGTSVERNSHV